MKVAVPLLLWSAMTVAVAQPVRSVDQPFGAQPAKDVPPVTVDAPYEPDGKAGQPPVTADLPVAAPKSVDDVVDASPLTLLVPGKSVATQLAQIAEKAGWQLAWEATDFQIEQKVVVSADIVKAIEAVVDSANAGETKLRADFYNGNKLVRITDF